MNHQQKRGQRLEQCPSWYSNKTDPRVVLGDGQLQRCRLDDVDDKLPHLATILQHFTERRPLKRAAHSIVFLEKNFSWFIRFVKFYHCINSYIPCCLIIFTFTYCSVQCVMNHRDNLNMVGVTFTYLSVLISPTCNCQHNMKLSFYKSGGIKTGRKILVAMPTLLGKGLHRLWQHAHKYLHDLSLRNIILFCTLMWYTQLFLV